MAGHLALTRKAGEGIHVGDAHIKIQAIKGNRVRVYITADENVKIRRDEVPDRPVKVREGKKAS